MASGTTVHLDAGAGPRGGAGGGLLGFTVLKLSVLTSAVATFAPSASSVVVNPHAGTR